MRPRRVMPDSRLSSCLDVFMARLSIKSFRSESIVIDRKTSREGRPDPDATDLLVVRCLTPEGLKDPGVQLATGAARCPVQCAAALLRRATVRARATVADHGDALNFQHHPRRGKVRYGN